MMLRFSICGTRYYFTFKFFGLTCCFIVLFSSLGLWQYHRAQQKRLLLAAYAARSLSQPLAFKEVLNTKNDHRFYSLRMSGHFDNQHLILLDNTLQEGKIGYEVYSPFFVENHTTAILIDRGWIEASQNRAILPQLSPVESKLTIRGVLTTPPAYFALGAMTETQPKRFPLRIQYVDLKELTTILGYPLAPYVLWLDKKDPQGFKRSWKITVMGPERHILYTVQWFAFALSLLVIFVVLNVHREK